MKKSLIPAFSLVIALFASSPVFSVGSPAQSAAPDFKVKDLNGKEHTLAEYKGKVLFLNFWATWCPPCRAEVPDFVEAYKAFKDQGLEILGISVDEGGVEAVKPFASKYKVNYPLAMVTEQIYLDYQPGAYIPTTFLIDKSGRIRDKIVGQINKEAFLAAFNKLKDE